MRKIFLILVVAILFCSTDSWGWGKKGHGLVAEVAFSLMDSVTRAKVYKYIDDMSIEQAGSWMDEIRSDHRYDYMKEWHYVNIEKGETYQPNKDANAVNELVEAIGKLQHHEKLSDEEIRRNILVVMHLVGDLHQPLHVGYGNDKGGNDVHVRFNGQATNLHRVWDTELIEKENITAKDCLQRLKHFDKQDVAMFSKIDVVNWMRIPRSQLGAVYDFKDGNIDEDYIKKNKTVIEDDILIAGIRLAAVLNSAFKSS